MEDQTFWAGLGNFQGMMQRAAERCTTISRSERLLGYFDEADQYEIMSHEMAEAYQWMYAKRP